VLAQGGHIVPIPGTKHVRYLEDNLGALQVRLTADELCRLDETFPQGVTAGPRYPARAMRFVNG
jgi:aryl-alcohol dehydrogenase-like predicted oxidoreductase